MANELNLSSLVSRLLTVRGITTPDEARKFLDGGAESLHDPFLMKGMKEAVARIRLALERGEKIRIYGDYDADGVCSTTLMIYLFRRLDARFDMYIPHRLHEGYGLNREALDDAKENGVSLIVTVDTGISAKDEIAYASELGIDVVVTDHHEPPEQLPEAVAVVNPKQPGCPYPFKQLAGVGVAFKLATALLGAPPLEWLEFVAIGTVADLMPLVDENRIIVKLGLQELRSTRNPGLQALIRVADVGKKQLTEAHIGYALGPRINACGRLDRADRAVRLLTTSDKQEAEQLAEELDVINRERQKIVETMTSEALELLEAEGADPARRKVIVVAREGWSVGVVGIVAAKLLEKFYRPTVVLSIDPDTGMAKGSARSIAGFDIYQALTECAGLLDHYGGHQAAAGMSLAREHVPELRDRLEQLAQEWLTEEDLIPATDADLVCRLDEITLETIDELASLAPFGIGNPQPRVVVERAGVRDMRLMGSDRQHLKLVLKSPGGDSPADVEAIGFGMGMLSDLISSQARINVLGELSVNEWNGTRRAQLIIHDLCIPHPQVFDWRGGKAEHFRFPGNTMVGPGIAGNIGRLPAVVVFQSGDAHSVPGEWLQWGWPLFLISEQKAIPLNEAAEREPLHTATDLVLYTLPDRLERLHQCLEQSESAVRIYALFLDRQRARLPALPNREAFKSVYALVRHQAEWTRDERSLAALSKRCGLSAAAVEFIIDVFEELDFIVRDGNVYRVQQVAGKRDLAESGLYSSMEQRSRIESLLVYGTSADLSRYLISCLPHRIQMN